LKSKIKNMVKLSEFDILSSNLRVPAESVFGNFDIVLCRNLLIYYENDFQTIIFNKLYNSLINDGILILGESETPPNKYKSKFIQTSKNYKIYKKIS